MSILTEFTLFRKCIAAPILLDIDSLKLPKDPSFPELSELKQKKSLKLVHQVWSGLTKYLRQACTINNKSIEIPGLGIFQSVGL